MQIFGLSTEITRCCSCRDVVVVGRDMPSFWLFSAADFELRIGDLKWQGCAELELLSMLSNLVQIREETDQKSDGDWFFRSWW